MGSYCIDAYYNPWITTNSTVDPGQPTQLKRDIYMGSTSPIFAFPAVVDREESSRLNSSDNSKAINPLWILPAHAMIGDCLHTISSVSQVYVYSRIMKEL